MLFRSILGAGIAGLNAGLIFKDHKIDFKIFEATNRAGGRIFTLCNTLGEGLVSELGGEYIDSNHNDILKLADRFNLSLVDIELKIKQEKLIKDSYFFNQLFISEQVILNEFKCFASYILSDIKKIESGDIEVFKYFDHISISEYLKSKGISGWLFQLIEQAFTAEYGIDAKYQSSLNFLTMIDAAPGETLRLYGASDERYKVQGGNQLLIEKMADVLSNEIEYDCQCDFIGYQDNMFQIKLKNGFNYFCKFLLVTIPFTALRNVKLNLKLPLEKQKVIDELHYGTNSKLIFGLNESIWKKIGRSGYLFSNFIQNGWDSSISHCNNLNASYTIFQGGAAGSALNISKSDVYLRELDMIFPDFGKFANSKKLEIGRAHV